MARIVSAYKACKLLNCSMRDLGTWRSQGMPYIREGKGYCYDMELVHRWFSGEEFSKDEVEDKAAADKFAAAEPDEVEPVEKVEPVNPSSGVLPESWRCEVI